MVEELRTRKGDSGAGSPSDPLSTADRRSKTIAALPHTPQNAAPPVRPLVLVVDSRDGVESLIQKRLEDAGYEVIRAADSASALKFGRELHPDLIIVEAAGAATESLVLIRELQRRGAFSPAAVVFEADIEAEALHAARADGEILFCIPEPAEAIEVVAIARLALGAALAARKRSFLRVPEHAEDGDSEQVLCGLNLAEIIAGFVTPPELTESV